MDITISEMKRVTLIEISGRIDSTNATKLGEALNEQIDAGRHQLVADLARVDYMSSAGLRELVSAVKKLRKLNGDLRVASPSPRVKEVLDLAGLDSIFQMFTTPVEAVGSF
ncbi:MAG: STAS domain-containing protein [Anaerolineae bacterium]|jgi:anti-anti-sigma factor|nr:STAS domain-containing protein [Anaerolineae bacterium]